MPISRQLMGQTASESEMKGSLVETGNAHLYLIHRRRRRFNVYLRLTTFIRKSTCNLDHINSGERRTDMQAVPETAASSR